MQATIGTRQVRFNWVNGSIFTVALALGLAVAFIVGVMVGRESEGTRIVGQTAAPKAYYVAQAGEGLVGGNHGSVATLKAFTPELAGEGIVGGNREARSQETAFFVPSAGEGLVGSHLPAVTASVKAYDVEGAGEGWLGHGQSVAALKAIYNPNMGEGLLAGYGEVTR